MRVIHKYVHSISGKPPLSGVNVDEAVALGAAIRANITEKGETVGLIGQATARPGGPVMAIAGAKAVTDVTAHSLGMIAVSPDGEAYINSIIIPKNTKIPAANKRPFQIRTRKKDNEIEVYVVQGEYTRPLDNTIAYKYVITDIEHTSSSMAVIEVTYEYTANGVIEVSAVQKETGKRLPIRIEPVPEDMSWTELSPKEHMEQNGGSAEVEVILAVDLSGSMSGTPVREAMKAMNNFVRQFDSSNTYIGVIAFADRVRVLIDPTQDFKAVEAVIAELENVNVGICNRAHPFQEAYSILGAQKQNGRVRYIVVLTDGCWSCRDEAIAEANRCHKVGIEVMALGFGDADHKFLKKIASTDAFASVTQLSDLSGSFSKIAQAIGDGATGLSVF